MSEQPSESARQAIVPDTAAGRRFDAVVAELFPEYSRSRLTEWIKAGEVLLDRTLGYHRPFVFQPRPASTP